MQYHVPASEKLFALIEAGDVPHITPSTEVPTFIAFEVPENATHEDLERIKEDLCAYVDTAVLDTEVGVALALTAGFTLGSIASEIDARIYSAATENTSQPEEEISHSLPTGDATISISATQTSDRTESEEENGTTKVKEVRGERKRR